MSLSTSSFRALIRCGLDPRGYDAPNNEYINIKDSHKRYPEESLQPYPKMDFLPLSLNSATIAGLLAIILFSYYLLKRSRVGLAKTAPTPAGAWPVIGHLPLLGATQTPHITLGAMADKYGPLFTIKLGLHPALVLSSWEMAKECFTTNDLAVSSRPKLVAIKHLCYNYAMFGFAPHGPYWRELRKISNHFRATI